MASHARKPKGLSAKTILIAIASVLVVGILIIAIVLISNGGFTIFAGWLSSDEGDSSSAVSTNASEPASSEPVYTPIFSRPDQMRGVWLTPGVDFWKSADDTAETVKKRNRRDIRHAGSGKSDRAVSGRRASGRPSFFTICTF